MTVLPAPAAGPDDSFDELSRALWAQRALIETLQYRLEIQQLVCINNRAHLLQAATDEVEAAMDELRRGERTRDRIVAGCASALRLDPGVTLAGLRNAVGEPWASVLREHQEALLSLVAATEQVAATNRELVARGARDARSLMDAIGGSSSAPGYGPASGSTGSGRTLAAPTLVDRSA